VFGVQLDGGIVRSGITNLAVQTLPCQGDRLGRARVFKLGDGHRAEKAGAVALRDCGEDQTRGEETSGPVRRKTCRAKGRGPEETMSGVTIYHNPRCSTSRKTLDLIRAKGIEPTIIEYLKNPPTATDLDRILTLLKMEPRDLMRKKENEFKTLGLDRSDRTRKDLINAMAKHPILIERPIVLSKGKAALGRPPENVETIL
jgi:arsenate reductase